MGKIGANSLSPNALKSCPKSKILPNLVTLIPTYTIRLLIWVEKLETSQMLQSNKNKRGHYDCLSVPIRRVTIDRADASDTTGPQLESSQGNHKIYFKKRGFKRRI